jgi:lipoyl(octanoyl) transferase
LGRQNYADSMRLMSELAQKVKQNPERVFILGLEYDTLLTLGRNAKVQTEISESLNTLPVHQSARGGLATLHNPGQLIVYPIVSLSNLKLGVADWVCRLSQVTQATLRDFHIHSQALPPAGLHTENGKIASIGLRIENRVSTHGVAINISNDLSLFSNFRVCGLREQRMDSILAQRGQAPELKSFFTAWAGHFVQRSNL